jgi:outer membrane protein assembly factor BamB
MKKTLALLAFLFSFYAAVSAQINSSHIFSKAWVYPDIPENIIINNIIDENNNPACPVLPPDSMRAFGNISGMAFDSNDNLYVWDDGYLALWKFTPDGKRSWRRKFVKDGNAEGTFKYVGLAFAVSDDGQVCLGDKSNKTLSLLDSSGNFIRRFKVDMMPGTITFGKDGSLYVTGFAFTYSGDLVRHYSATGQLLGSFCKRLGDKAIDWSGNSGHLTTDKDGNIYFAHFYPYKIEKFSKDGVPLKTIERKSDNFIAPKFVSGDGRTTVESQSGLRGLTYIPQGYLSVIASQNVKKKLWTMDLIDLEGNIKASLSSKEYPIDFWCRYSACDSKGNLYYDLSSKTDPVIVKYNVNYDELVKK